MRYILKPVSSLAQQIHAKPLNLTGSTRFGRNVDVNHGIRFAAQLAQISGRHCRIFPATNSQGELTWAVEDTSTNGTFVNGERVPKAGSLPLNHGDSLRLSTPPGEVVEYLFEVEADGPHTDAGPSAVASKRRMSNEETSEVDMCTTHKRAKASPQYTTEGHPIPPSVPTGGLGAASAAQDVRHLATLEKTNQDLRRKLEQHRQQIEDRESKLKAVTSQHNEVVRALETKLEETEKQARARAATVSEAAAAELETWKLRATKSEAKMKELEQKVTTEKALREEAESSAASSKAREVEVAREAEELRSQVQSMKLEFSAMQTKLRCIETEREALNKKVLEQAAELVQEQDRANSALEQLAAEMQSAEAAKKVAESSEADAQKAMLDVEAERKARVAAENLADSLRQQLEDVQRRLDCAEDRAQAKQERMVVQRAQIKMALSNTDSVKQLLQSVLKMTTESEHHLQEAVKGGEEVMTDPGPGRNHDMVDDVPIGTAAVNPPPFTYAVGTSAFHNTLQYTGAVAVTTYATQQQVGTTQMPGDIISPNHAAPTQQAAGVPRAIPFTRRGSPQHSFHEGGTQGAEGLDGVKAEEGASASDQTEPLERDVEMEGGGEGEVHSKAVYSKTTEDEEGDEGGDEDEEDSQGMQSSGNAQSRSGTQEEEEEEAAAAGNKGTSGREGAGDGPAFPPNAGTYPPPPTGQDFLEGQHCDSLLMDSRKEFSHSLGQAGLPGVA